MVESSVPQVARAPVERPSHARRAPWRRGAWSQREVAAALQARRSELLGILRSRGDGRGMSETFLAETVDDAVSIVTMMRRPVSSEAHLMGAFWTTVRILLRHNREGRNEVRVGSRSRVGLEDVAGYVAADDLGPQEVLELRDRAARAADFVSQLTDTERDVVVATAVHGAGIKLAARRLGMPVKDVKSAERAARAKLDRVALIASAGRMCGYREGAISSYARGSASAETERVARAHLAACAACRAQYAGLVREMRGRRFQRDAAAAFLPPSVAFIGHHVGLLGRLAGWTASRPHIGGERAAEAFGGAGAVKAAAAGSAIVAATATLVAHTPILSTQAPPHHRVRVDARAAARHPTVAATSTASAAARASSYAPKAPSTTVAHMTPQEHAEMEFSLHPSGSSTPDQRSAPAASAADVREEAPPVEAQPSKPSASTSAAPAGSPSAAEREFGQP